MDNEFFNNGFGAPVPEEPKPEVNQEAPAEAAAETVEPSPAPAAEPAPASTYHYSYSQINQTPVQSEAPASPAVPAPAPAPSAGYGAGFNNASQPAAAPVYNQSVPNAAPAAGAPAKKPSNKTAIVVICAIVICLILAAVGIAASMSKGNGNSGTSSKEETTASESAQVETAEQAEVATTDKDGNYTVAGVAQNCIDSCVGITIYSKTTANSFYNFGYGSESQSGEESIAGYGSGVFMLESNGKTYVLTCAHVISDGTRFVITTNDGDEYDATMVGYDSQTDIGVLVVNATGFKIAEFADSSSTVVGEQCVAIGCPGGLDFMNSVSSGYVSALDRPISSSIGYKNECIQTDAAINPGNSGGALFNMQGQVIGINSSKIAATEYEGIGFAVPSNTAIATANSLIKVGYVEGRAKIGITYTNIGNYSNSYAILNALQNLGYENADGTMVINEVSEDSDLASKDIRQYDMIVAVNGTTMTSTDIMTSVLADSKPGDTITLTIARVQNNQIDTFDVECKLIEAKG